MRESLIEDYLVQEVKKRTGEIRKVKWIGRRNAPDRFVMFKNDCFWVEVKALGEKPSKMQQIEFLLMQSFGLHVYVVDSFDKVDQLMAGTLPQWRP